MPKVAPQYFLTVCPNVDLCLYIPYRLLETPVCLGKKKKLSVTDNFSPSFRKFVEERSSFENYGNNVFKSNQTFKLKQVGSSCLELPFVSVILNL